MSERFDKFEAVVRMRAGKKVMMDDKFGPYRFDGLRMVGVGGYEHHFNGRPWHDKCWSEYVEPFDHTKLKHGDEFEVSLNDGLSWETRRFIGNGFGVVQFYYAGDAGPADSPTKNTMLRFRFKQ